MTALSPLRTGLAVALTAAIASLACAALVYIDADRMVAFVNSWLHGLDIAALRVDKPWSIGGVLGGAFNAAATGFVIGALYALCRDLVAGRAGAR